MSHNAREEYKAAYSAIRNKARGLAYWQDSVGRFEVNKTFYRAIVRLSMKTVIQAEKSYATRCDSFNGWVFMNWTPNLRDYRLYGQYMSSGSASRMIRAYAQH